MFENKKGYTLVELLTVAGVLAAVSGLIIGILFSSLRGGAKTTVTNDISQNGNSAMDIMTRELISAAKITEVGGTPVVTDCVGPIHPTGNSIKIEKENSTLVTFACTPPPDNSITRTESLLPAPPVTTQLIDIARVKATSCTFTCRQLNNDPYASPIVDVSFTISQKANTTASQDIAESTFNTSVTVRNFKPF